MEYNIKHFETPNEAPCAYGNSDLNFNGCSDRITVNYNDFNENIVLDGQNYILNISGFQLNGNPWVDVLAPEDRDRQGSLYASLTLASPAVPEPATWAMMIIGFGAVGFAARRRRETSATLA